MKQPFKNHRFIERDYIFKCTKKMSEHLTDAQINALLDMRSDWMDITYKLYTDGSVKVIDNNGSGN